MDVHVGEVEEKRPLALLAEEAHGFLCVPARTSLFYGAFPHEVMLPGTETDMGARLEDPKRRVRPEASGRLLLPQLAEVGYDCAYAGKWHVGQWGPTESLPDDARERFGVEKLCDIHDARTVRAAAGFLSRTHEAPFFLVASFDNPHNIHEWAMEGALPEGDLPEPPAPPHLPPLPPECVNKDTQRSSSRAPISRHGIFIRVPILSYGIYGCP